MSKRGFRTPPPTSNAPGYPTLESFDQSSRRGFLGKLGLLGAAILGVRALAACDTRAVPGAPPDGGPGLDGELPKPPPPDPDFGIAGGATPFDAEIDKRDRGVEPDVSTLEGDVAGPDARIDDLSVSPGFAPTLDARVDGCSLPDPKPTP